MKKKKKRKWKIRSFFRLFSVSFSVFTNKTCQPIEETCVVFLIISDIFNFIFIFCRFFLFHFFPFHILFRFSFSGCIFSSIHLIVQMKERKNHFFSRFFSLNRIVVCFVDSTIFFLLHWSRKMVKIAISLRIKALRTNSRKESFHFSQFVFWWKCK